jgi:hypothetical protein
VDGVVQVDSFLLVDGPVAVVSVLHLQCLEAISHYFNVEVHVLEVGRGFSGVGHEDVDLEGGVLALGSLSRVGLVLLHL